MRYIERLVSHVDEREYDLALVCPDHTYLEPLRATFRAKRGTVWTIPAWTDSKSVAYQRVHHAKKRNPLLRTVLGARMVRDTAKVGLALHGLSREYSIERELRRYLSRARPDLLHVNLDRFPDSAGRLAMIAGKSLGARVVATLHTTPQPPVFPTSIHNLSDRRALRASDCTIVLAEAFKGMLHRWYDAPQASLEKIPNGVPRAVFEPQGGLHRSALGLREEDVVVMHVGSINPMRGQHVLIEAAALLVRDWPALRIVFVGGDTNPSYAQQCRELAASTLPPETVRWTGYRTDAARLWPLADIAVLSSFTEAHPFALIEAMACARPVVATDVGAVRESMEDGSSGLVVPTGDARAMAAAIGKLCVSPELRQSMGARALALASERFTEERMSSDTFAVYRRVTSAATRRPTG